MYGDDGYTTEEGHWLARPLLLPQARSFGELFEYVREWDHATMSHYRGTVPRPDLVPAPAMIDRNEVGPFCSIRLGSNRRSVAVVARPAVLDVVRDRIVTQEDRLSFEVIEHAGRNRALVILSHGHIIGSHWLAYIDPSTIPAAAPRVTLHMTETAQRTSGDFAWICRCGATGQGLPTRDAARKVADAHLDVENSR